MILKRTGPGGSIALIAPSSPFDRALYEQGRAILDGAGFRTVPGKNIFSANGYQAGSDVERAGDLTDAIRDPGIEAIVCIRGGYGSGRILPWLNFHSLKNNHKILIGHSDITFVHLALLARMGWITFHGPNLTGIGESPERAQSVIDALCGTARFEWNFGPEQVLRHGAAIGQVIGGNLTCLSHLVGTPFLPDLMGALLLIEDRGEALYRLDRIINHLKLAGILEKLGAILLGEFENCAENTKINEMVMEHVKYFDFPVIHDLPFGHGRRNEVIPLGAPFVLDTHERVLRIQSPIIG